MSEQDPTLTHATAPKTRRPAKAAQTLVEQIAQLSVEEQAKLAAIFDQATAETQERRAPAGNEAVSSYVLQHGDCQHGPDFMPVPSEGVMELGEAAVAKFHAEHRAGRPFRSRDSQFNPEEFADVPPTVLEP